jgi:hypothetical protein
MARAPLIAAAFGAALSACGASLEEVPRGRHPVTSVAVPIVVDTKPPVPAIETIGSPPSSDCLWVDGSWTFGADGWTWLPGRWVRLQNDCYYAESSLVWVPAVNQPGALFFTPGEWYRRSDGAPWSPPQECRAE